MNLDIYFYTGTGNSLRTSEWMLDIAKDRGAETRIGQIKDGVLNYDNGKSSLIGFVYPTHGFNAVPAMLNFLSKFPKGVGKEVFFVNCRAGCKIGRLYIPGISGMALIIPAIIMLLKGYSVRGVFSVNPPSNWTSIHPGYGPKTVEALLAKTKKRAQKYMLLLLDGKTSFKRMIIDFPIDILIIPITFIYYFVGRFFLAKTFIHTSDCTKCGICSTYCPVGAIKVINGNPFWTYNCESCMRCMNVCPHNAVQSSHLIFAGAILVGEIPFNVLMLELFPQMQIFENYWWSLLFNSVLSIAILFVGYRIIHPLFGTKALGWLFKYTSLTTYWRRYNMPGLKIKELK